MSAPCSPTSVADPCRGMGLPDVLCALTLLSLSSLLLLRYAETLQISEQTQWLRRETWRQLAQRLEGENREQDSINLQYIPIGNGCYWQRAERRVEKQFSFYLERLRCQQ